MLLQLLLLPLTLVQFTAKQRSVQLRGFFSKCAAQSNVLGRFILFGHWH
jgi:hypothetical protein